MAVTALANFLTLNSFRFQQPAVLIQQSHFKSSKLTCTLGKLLEYYTVLSM